MSLQKLWESFPILETERLLLRQKEDSDATAMLEIFSDPAVIRYLDIGRLNKLSEAEEIIAEERALYADKRGLRWAIVRKADDRYLGSCGFHQIDAQARCLEIGYEIGRPYWRKGYTTEALTEVIRFGFEALDLNRIEAMIDPRNVGSIATAAKVGMQKEGILRERFHFNGELRDELVMSILRSEYEAAK